MPPKKKYNPGKSISNLGKEGFGLAAQIDSDFRTSLIAEYMDGQKNKYGLSASVPASQSYFADPTGQTEGISQSSFNKDDAMLEAYMNLKPTEDTFINTTAGVNKNGTSWGVNGGYNDGSNSLVASTNDQKNWEVAAELELADKIRAQGNISEDSIGGGLTYEHLADKSKSGVGDFSAFLRAEQDRKNKDNYRANVGIEYKF